jgi:hypothetical protein
MKKMRLTAPSSIPTLLMGLPRSTDKARIRPPPDRDPRSLLQKSHDLRPPGKRSFTRTGLAALVSRQSWHESAELGRDRGVRCSEKHKTSGSRLRIRLIRYLSYCIRLIDCAGRFLYPAGRRRGGRVVEGAPLLRE